MMDGWLIFSIILNLFLIFNLFKSSKKDETESTLKDKLDILPLVKTFYVYRYVLGRLRIAITSIDINKKILENCQEFLKIEGHHKDFLEELKNEESIPLSQRFKDELDFVDFHMYTLDLAESIKVCQTVYKGLLSGANSEPVREWDAKLKTMLNESEIFSDDSDLMENAEFKQAVSILKNSFNKPS